VSGGALTVAFSAGALAAFNPCGFALLPGWAAVLVSGEGSGGDDLLARLVRALRAGVLATIAFLLVFGLAGLVFSLGFAALGRYLAFVGLAIGLVLAWLGTLLLVDGHAPGLDVARRAGRGTDVRAVFGFGLAYALGSLSCVLPVFLLTLGIAAGEPFWTRVGGFVGFALGMGTVLALIALAAALTGEGAQKLQAAIRIVPRLAGAVVVGAAAVVLTRELGLAALSLGHHEPTFAVRSAVAAAATVLAATLALAAHGRGRRLVDALRRRPTAAPVPHPRRAP
jgi:cytochrome c-type biogenesis protein